MTDNAAQFAAWLNEPLLFIEHFWPGTRLYRKQAEILHSVRDNQETFVHACNESGKSFLASLLVLWWMCSRFPAKVIASSSSEAQLKDAMWGEVTRKIRAAKFPLGLQYKHLHLYTTDPNTGKPYDEHFARFHVTRNVENFQGKHLAADEATPRVLVLFDEACHDDQTDVLTDQGWKRFADLNGSELFLTMHPDGGPAKYAPATAIHRHRFKGDLVSVSRRGVDFAVTPKHRLRQHTRQGKAMNPWRWKTAEEASALHVCAYMSCTASWRVPDMPMVVVPQFKTARKTWPKRKLTGDDAAVLLGAFCSEGHVNFARGVPAGIGLTSRDASTRQRWIALLKRCGYRPREYLCTTTPQVQVHDRALGEWLLQLGKGCLVKRVPRWIGNMSCRQIRLFLQEYKAGDGYDKQNQQVIYTSSPKMADDLQELGIKAGYRVALRKRKLTGNTTQFATHKATSSCDGYVITLSKATMATTKHRDFKRVPYDGWVYCVTVPPHGMILTRRNGKCLWNGNSAIEDEFYEAAQSQAHRILVMGNPLSTENFFYRQCEAGDERDPDQPDRFARKVVHIDGLDSPNVQAGLRFKQLGHKGPPPTMLPGVLSWAQYRHRDRIWDQIKKRTRLHGHFYKGSEWLMFPPDVLDECERVWELIADLKRDGPRYMGVDVAQGGRDKTCWYIIDRFGVLFCDAKSTPDTTVIPEITLTLMREYGVPARHVCFDRGGGGLEHGQRLRKQGHNVRIVGFGQGAVDKLTYKNRRAEMYHALARAMNPKHWDIEMQLNDDGLQIASPVVRSCFAIPPERAKWFRSELRRELSVLPIMYDEKGMLKLPPKRGTGQEAERKRVTTIDDLIGHSPDDSDALALANWARYNRKITPRVGRPLVGSEPEAAPVPDEGEGSLIWQPAKRSFADRLNAAVTPGESRFNPASIWGDE